MIKLTRVQFDSKFEDGSYIGMFIEEQPIWVAPAAIRSMEERQFHQLKATCLYLGANQFPVVKESIDEILRMLEPSPYYAR